MKRRTKIIIIILSFVFVFTLIGGCINYYYDSQIKSIVYEIYDSNGKTYSNRVNDEFVDKINPRTYSLDFVYMEEKGISYEDLNETFTINSVTFNLFKREGHYQYSYDAYYKSGELAVSSTVTVYFEIEFEGFDWYISRVYTKGI